MRDIKFRAWDKELKEMRPVGILDIGGTAYYDDTYPETASSEGLGYRSRGGYELMQYTGLKDKNGVECYENDIITFNSNGYGDGKIMLVEWDKDFAGFMPFCDQIFSAADSYSEWEIESFKVIGNIYENPELLK